MMMNSSLNTLQPVNAQVNRTTWPMPVLMTLGVANMQPYHLMSPQTLAQWYLSHFVPLSGQNMAGPNIVGQNRIAQQQNSFQTALQTQGAEPQTELQALQTGLLSLTHLVEALQGNGQSLQGVTTQADHQLEMLERQVLNNPFEHLVDCGGLSGDGFNQGCGGTRCGNTGCVGIDAEAQPLSMPITSKTLPNAQAGPAQGGVNAETGWQTPLSQVTEETIRQYIWNLLYPGLRRQVRGKQDEEVFTTTDEQAHVADPWGNDTEEGLIERVSEDG